jgi:hypothetical protein
LSLINGAQKIRQWLIPNQGNSVYEKSRSAIDSRFGRQLQVTVDVVIGLLFRNAGIPLGEVETHLLRILGQVSVTQRRLMLEHQVVHLPEFPLSVAALRRDRSRHGSGMLAQRKVFPNPA